MKLNDALFLVWQVADGQKEPGQAFEQAAQVIQTTLEKLASKVIYDETQREDLCAQVFVELLGKEKPLSDRAYNSEKEAHAYLRVWLINRSRNLALSIKNKPTEHLDKHEHQLAHNVSSSAKVTIRSSWNVFSQFAHQAFSKRRKDARISLEKSLEQLVELARGDKEWKDLIQETNITEGTLQKRHSRMRLVLQQELEQLAILPSSEQKDTFLSHREDIRQWINWLRQNRKEENEQ